MKANRKTKIADDGHRIIIDGAACKECCPGVPGTWHDYGTVHRCNNCGHERRPRRRPRLLPDNPTLDDLTPSQRSTVETLRATYEREREMMLIAAGRHVLVIFRPVPGAQWWVGHRSFRVGPRGKAGDV